MLCIKSVRLATPVLYKRIVQETSMYIELDVVVREV
jgi:hypothetical protein